MTDTAINWAIWIFLSLFVVVPTIIIIVEKLQWRENTRRYEENFDEIEARYKRAVENTELCNSATIRERFDAWDEYTMACHHTGREVEGRDQELYFRTANYVRERNK